VTGTASSAPESDRAAHSLADAWDGGRASGPAGGSAAATDPIECIDVGLVRGRQEVLREVTLTVRPGEILGIMGRTGCGKSSLLRCMTGLLRPTSGRMLLFGEDVRTLGEDALNGLRRRAGMVFQAAALFDSLSVFENVAFHPRRFSRLTEPELQALVAEKLALVGMEGTEHLMPGELSGGMAKRVGIARALASDPEVILYDEPEAGLDPIMRGTVDRVIRDLRERLHMTSVIVTHDVEHALRLVDRAALLHGNTVHFLGTPEEFRETSDPVVRQFVAGAADGPLTDGLMGGPEAGLDGGRIRRDG
jgi:phospholipid/cholesterol/gamma-HCH transport system ATP-binding protein